MKVAVGLRLSDDEIKLFIELVNQKHGRSKKVRAKATTYLQENHSEKSLSLDGFKVLSDWYYFAILSVMELDNFTGKADWISGRLDLSLSKVEQALETLSKLEFIKEVDGLFVLQSGGLTITHDISSFALKESHKQSIKQAMNSVDSVAVGLRDITSMTMTMDLSKMSQAKEIIKKFRRQFTSLMESGKKEEVYNLNIQFVPITKLKKEDVL